MAARVASTVSPKTTQCEKCRTQINKGSECYVYRFGFPSVQHRRCTASACYPTPAELTVVK